MARGELLMAVDKLVDSTQLDNDIRSVAATIRSKCATSATLDFPADFNTAINGIPVAQATYKIGAVRPDAELVKTISYDKYIHADEEITIPAYSTTAKTLKASADYSETYTIDYANYNYVALVKTLTIPTYSVTSKAKGRSEYHFSSAIYEVVDIPANTMCAILDPTKKITSRSVTQVPTTVFTRLIYWSSGTAVSAYTSTTLYGPYQTITAPSISSGVMTFKTPALAIRGNATYLSSTYFSAITDIRYQWVIELWRVAKGVSNLDGWGLSTVANHIVACESSASQKLT